MLASLQLVLPQAAWADGTVLVSDDDHLKLSATGDKLTGTLSVSNDSDASVPITVTPGGGAAGCRITPSPESVAARRQSAITLTFTGCKPEASTRLVMEVGSQRFDLVADPEGPSPDFRVLFAFPAAAVFGALVVGLAWRSSGADVPRSSGGVQMLPGLAATWKFTDSWASNATVITAAFSGVFGAKEVAAVVLGSKSDAVVSLAIVAAAVAVGLVALGPMLVQAARTWTDTRPETKDGGSVTRRAVPSGYYVTPLGLFLGGAVTLAGTVGQLVVLLIAVRGVISGTVSVAIGVLAVGVVAWYAAASTRQSLRAGSDLSPADSKGSTADPGLAAGSAVL